MDLHSYAKRKAPKKWAIEHKRRLVEVRIKHDHLFNNSTGTNVVSWQKILTLSKLEEYTVASVCKQWSNMIMKYKMYKLRMTRHGNSSFPVLDDEMIAKITQEWEFFQDIHSYMARKTTNLHSYALQNRQNGDADQIDMEIQQQQQEQQQNVQQQPLNLTNNVAMPTVGNNSSSSSNNNNNNYHSSTENLHHFSSDTNEEFALITDASTAEAPVLERNTDHDFYSKRLEHNEQSSYFADTSNDAQDAVEIAARIKLEHGDVTIKTEPAEALNEIAALPTLNATQQIDSHPIALSTPYTALGSPNAALISPFSAQQDAAATAATSAKIPLLKSRTCQTEVKRLLAKEKYYRHKRRFNHRLEQRFNAIIKVVGQVMQAKFPDIDISPLEEITNATNAALMQSDDSSSSNCEDENE